MIINALAPVFADPTGYPVEVQSQVAREIRRAKIINGTLIPMINSLDLDVIGMQEVSRDTVWATNSSITIQGELKYFKAALEAKGYISFYSANDRGYWGFYAQYNYYDYANPYVYNSYVDTGVAIFLKASRFTAVQFQDIRLSTGNHLNLVNAFDNQAGEYVRFANCHWDSDYISNRRPEAEERQRARRRRLQLAPAPSRRSSIT
jgi:hypothetical protein